MFDLRFAARWPEHGYQIKTAGAMRRTVALEIMPGGTLDTMPFGGVDGVDQLRVLIGPACLDFDKDHRVTVERDEINLTEGAEVISSYDAMTTPAQTPSGYSLSARAEKQMPTPFIRRLRRAFFSSCWQQVVYEREVHGAYVSCRPDHAGSRAWRDGPCRGA